MAASHDTPVLRCEHCGRVADGIDQHGYPICTRHADRERGYRTGVRCAALERLEDAIARALENYCTASDIRATVQLALPPLPSIGELLEGGEL